MAILKLKSFQEVRQVLEVLVLHHPDLNFMFVAIQYLQIRSLAVFLQRLFEGSMNTLRRIYRIIPGREMIKQGSFTRTGISSVSQPGPPNVCELLIWATY